MIRYVLPLALIASPVFAGEADVIAAKASKSSGNSWRVDATVQHADTGWDHYSNHPHVNEQPFTRSVSVTVPEGITQITVRAVDSVHGHGGAEVTVDLN